jgi:DNA-3-methyladenine glycosylase
VDLARGALFVARAQVPPRIATGPRIGVAYAGAWADRPLRFWWADHPAVSRTPPPAAGPRPARTPGRPARRPA